MPDRDLASRSACFGLAGVLFFASAGSSSVVDASGQPVAQPPNATDANKNSARDTRTRLDEINILSEGLIEKAATGSSPAHQFRIEARIYRELLRQLMLDNRVLPVEEQIPQPPLLEMVRMSALLHAAADCKTGLVITCPPDLMRQMRSQQARIDRELELNAPMRE